MTPSVTTTLALMLITIACASRTPSQQRLTFNGQRAPKVGGLDDSSRTPVVLNFTFDDVDLAVLPNRTITSLGLLEFHHFEAVNMTTAVESGFLALGDLDCAVSRPNILHGVSEPYHTPSVIRTNASALAEAGLASYFDIVSFSWKPLGPAPPFVGIIMAVYRIDDGIPTYVDNMATIWSDDEDTSDGFLPPSTETPAEWWPGWGSKTNWIEIESWADHGESWQFCLDNLVLRFYKEDREDSE